MPQIWTIAYPLAKSSYTEFGMIGLGVAAQPDSKAAMLILSINLLFIPNVITKKSSMAKCPRG
jgi:hypothetical protein